MLPNLNPKQMRKMMKQLGMEMEEINAMEVIIKTPGKDILIKDPVVTKVKVQGQETFQIQGTITESLPEEDIRIVMEQTGSTREEALKALEETDDIAEAIIKLQGE